MNTFIHKTRVALIRIGKVLPFVICLIVLVSYAESCIGLYKHDFILYDDYVIINKPISFFIGNYFEYNVQMLVVLCVISISISTCIYNKLACVYLGVNLIEKSYFNFELEPTYIYIICITNIIVSSYLIYKGIRRL